MPVWAFAVFMFMAAVGGFLCGWVFHEWYELHE